MNYRLVVAAAAGAALLVGCSRREKPLSTGPDTPREVAHVRIVNAAAGLAGDGSVDVARGSTTIASGLGFRAASTQCVDVPVGQRTLTFRDGSGANAVASLPVNLTANQNATVVLFGTGAAGTTPSARLFTDDFTAPTAGNNALRFINATGTAGDIFLTTPTGTLGTATQSNLASFAGTTSFGAFPTANTRVRLFDVGSTTGTPRADFTLPTLAGNRAATVVLTGASNATDPAAFVVAPCS